MRTSEIFDPLTGTARIVSKLGLGCSRIGSLGNAASLAESEALIGRALDLGVNVFDTADIYGQGDSERVLGRALRGRRQDAFVITKFGKRFSPAMRLLQPLKPALKPLLAMRGATAAVGARRKGAMREDFSPTWLERALDRSLRRLCFDYVDAVLLHSPPLRLLRDPGVIETLAVAQKAGKTIHFGVSCDQWEQFEAAISIPGLSILQAPLDVISRADAEGLRPAISKRRITVIAREAIRLQPNLLPVDAISAASLRPCIAIVVAGTGSSSHLDQLALACH